MHGHYSHCQQIWTGDLTVESLWYYPLRHNSLSSSSCCLSSCSSSFSSSFTAFYFPSNFFPLKNCITKWDHASEKILTKSGLTVWIEAPLKKLLNFDVCVVWWCSDGPLNSQEHNFFIYLCGLYQDIYDWISPLNKRSGRPFILTQQSMGEMSMVFLVTCIFSLFWST